VVWTGPRPARRALHIAQAAHPVLGSDGRLPRPHGQYCSGGSPSTKLCKGGEKVAENLAVMRNRRDFPGNSKCLGGPLRIWNGKKSRGELDHTLQDYNV